MDKFQDFYILEGDKILERAMRKDRVTDVKDYQKAHLNKALQFCKQTRIGIDIGANYGIMSYNMSKVFGHVYAFEIDKNVYECLDRNVKELGLKNVDIFPYGLGDTTKTVGLNVKPGKSFSTHVNEDGNDAQIKTLDSFGFDSVDFLKISETPTNNGLLFSMTQPKGEIEVSHEVKANKPSIVLSGETPEGR